MVVTLSLPRFAFRPLWSLIVVKQNKEGVKMRMAYVLFPTILIQHISVWNLTSWVRTTALHQLGVPFQKIPIEEDAIFPPPTKTPRNTPSSDLLMIHRLVIAHRALRPDWCSLAHHTPPFGTYQKSACSISINVTSDPNLPLNNQYLYNVSCFGPS